MSGRDMAVRSLAPASHARGTIRLPGSKSLSNRVLLLAALAEGSTTIEGLLRSDDTDVMIGALERLGVTIRREEDRCEVEGRAGRWTTAAVDLFVGNSGLSIRTLVPALAATWTGDAAITLRGVPRMHERPIGDLVDGLARIGARIDYLERPGYPPLRVHAAALAPGTWQVRGDTSSQFLTGLLQAAPSVAREAPVRIVVEGTLISRPYVAITLATMARFGVLVEEDDGRAFEVAPGQRYASPGVVAIEGDASSASYFLAAGALGGGPVRVLGAGRASVQGDVRFADALEAMGATIMWGDDWIECSGSGGLQGMALDCNAIPDAAMTLAVCAARARGTTVLRNIGSWRVKETDRIAAMATELRKFGATVEEGADFLRIDPPTHPVAAEVDTYDDHRMAMSLALMSVGVQGVEVRVRDPGCVAKTFPGYFDALASLCGP